MSTTTFQHFVATHRSGLTLSVLGHGLILVALSSSLLIFPAPPMQQLAIEAVVVESRPAPKVDEAQQRRAEQEQQRQQAEQERLQEQQRQAEQQRQQQAEQERQRQQVERDRQLQQEREAKAAADRKVQQDREAKAAAERKAQEQREAEARAKAEQERRDAEARAKAEAERKAAAAKAAEQARRQADLIAAMEAEEALLAARSSGEMAEYVTLIQQAVQRKWNKPGSAQPGLECEVLVQQLPSGEVMDVRVARCNGDEAVRRSVEVAVQRASPLPLPANRALFERNLRFVFKPEQ